MKNGKLFHMILKLHNYPRWDDYAPRLEDNTASHSYRVAVFALIASLIEKEKFHKEVDIEKVVCRSIFHDLNEIMTGSINHNTKKDPIVTDLIKEVENKGDEVIVSHLSGSIQDVFRDYLVNAEDETFEGRIVDAVDTLEAMFFCYREVIFGSTYYFPQKFEELAEKMRNHELESIRYIMKSFDEKDELYIFMFSVMMLSRVRRWKGKTNLIHDDDTTHTFRATAIAIFNTVLENKKYGNNMDLLSVAAKTLLHDLVEQRTGDVLGPVKKSSPEIKEAFEKYEKKVSQEMIEFLPDFIKDKFIDYMVNAKDETPEGEMVHIVDKIDALLKSNEERKINPREYEREYVEMLKYIQENFEQKSVVFFLAYILHDLNYMGYMR